MPTHLERELALMERRMDIREQEGAESALVFYKKFLRTASHHVEQQHRNGGSGRTVAKVRSQAMDVMIRHIWKLALQEQSGSHTTPDMSVVAQGGYGRAELSPQSDIDLLFLVRPTSGPEQKLCHTVIERVLYVLWDVGLKVGHATRTVQQTLGNANEDLQTKTALIDARLLTGEKTLFAELQERFIAKCVEGMEGEYIEWRLKDQQQRHAKYGGSVFMQEPNVKEGCGGLRDYHSFLWIAFFWKRLRTPSQLADHELIARLEVKQIERAYDFLMRVRNQMHLAAGRENDAMAISSQGQIATGLGYEQRPPVRRVEAFMRDYYTAAQDIFFLTNAAAHRMAETASAKHRSWFSFLRKKTAARPETVDGFIIRNREITFEDKSVFTEDPDRMVRVFQLAQKRDLSLSYDLLRLIRRRLSLVNHRFIYLKTTREMILDLLGEKGRVSRVLRLMHQAGVLGKIFPEFAPMTCLVQHEFFHRYSADEHTLKCMEELDRLVNVDTVPDAIRYQQIMKEVEDPAILYLAVLLHDTGKPANSRHHAEESAYLAMRVARRLKLSTESLKKLTFIVDHHMTMSETAQRRNVEDADTIREFAGIVETPERLDLLTLMTYVDGRGTTGGAGWSDWKETLIWRLYEGTRSLFAGSPEFEKRAHERYHELLVSLRERLPKYVTDEEIEGHLEFLPLRYRQIHDESEMARHIVAVHAFYEAQMDDESNPLAPIFRWEHHPARGHTKLVIVTWDRTHLFATITGAISCALLNILSADIFTRRDNIVVDSFVIRTSNGEAVTDERDQKAVADLLEKALSKEGFDMESHLASIRKKSTKSQNAWQAEGFPTRIFLDANSHSNYTLLEVLTPDRPALLHDLVQSITHEGDMIASSRIETEKGAAIDTFYITNPSGEKITDPQSLATLKERVLHCTGDLAPQKS